MRVFVQNWASYNAGRIVGAWIDLEDFAERDVFWAKVQEVTAVADEVMCADWEDAPVDFGQTPDWDLVWAIAEAVNGGLDAELLAAYADHVGVHYLPRDAADLAAEVNDRHLGTYNSLADYAEETTRGCADIPDFLDFYIDWEKMGRDMEMNGDVSAVERNGSFYVFDNH